MNNSNYKVFNNHHIGTSHVQKGMECEDYSMSFIDNKMAIAVISDGHGDKNCFRSAVGAKIACESAINVVRNVLSDDEGIYNIKQSPDRVILEIEKCIIYEWNSSVEKHLNEYPFIDEELSVLDDNIRSVLKAGSKTHKVYGCTLILNVVIEGFWFGIHIGDGKCVIVRNNGLYEQPIPWDNEGCVGNRSTSICSSNAIDSFRYHYDRDIPVALFVASDGVDESFDENGLNKCYYTLSLWINKLDSTECKKRTDELLNKISNGGSGDDVSIACIINNSIEIKKPIATSDQVADKMHELFVMLKESEARYKQLDDRLRFLEENTLKHEADIKELKLELEKKQAELDDMLAEKNSILNNIEPVKKQLAEMTKQFLQAKDVKRNVDNYWGALGVELKDNSEEMNYMPIFDIEMENSSVNYYQSSENANSDNITSSADESVEKTTNEISDKSIDSSDNTEITQDLKNKHDENIMEPINNRDMSIGEEKTVAYYPEFEKEYEDKNEDGSNNRSEKKKGLFNIFGKK